MHKVRIAEIFDNISKKYNFKTDISLKKEDTLFGDKWFEFLLRCKATIGVEGGASILDRDGTIRKIVLDYLKENPGVTFSEVSDKFLKKVDNALTLRCISPRHFEACITRTCQFLVEGNYNDIFIPWRHYIPIKKDYSNVEEVIHF